MGKASRTGIGQGELINLLRALRNMVFDDADLVVATTTTKIKTTNALYYMISGLRYTKGATDNIDITTGAGFTNTGVGQFCKLRIEIDSAGTVTAKQGGFATAQVLAQHPARSASKATIGYAEIPASFTFGTSNFNDSGVALVDGDPDLAATQLEA